MMNSPNIRIALALRNVIEHIHEAPKGVTYTFTDILEMIIEQINKVEHSYIMGELENER